jgi:hypothetical protein
MCNAPALWCVRLVGCGPWRQRMPSRAQFQVSLLKLGLLKLGLLKLGLLKLGPLKLGRRPASRFPRIQRLLHRFFPAMRGRL